LAGAAQQVKQVTRLEAEEATPYIGEALRRLREEVGNQAAVLGFVGAPFTLASYIVEGGSSKNYTHIKRLAFGEPDVLHALLQKLADNVADYVRYQARPLPLPYCASMVLRRGRGNGFTWSTICHPRKPYAWSEKQFCLVLTRIMRDL
jgi:hypothetical protein